MIVSANFGVKACRDWLIDIMSVLMPMIVSIRLCCISGWVEFEHCCFVLVEACVIPCVLA